MDLTVDPNAPPITKDFLEEALKFPLEKFVVNPGSILGDGYACVLYSVDVWKAGDLEPLHLLIKCFPSDPMRQHFLAQGEIFAVELGMYDTVIPELIKFQEDAGVEHKIKPPFAQFLAGRFTPKDQRDGKNNPLDNYIMMTDLRKSGGYRLRDRFQGFDLDHYKLVIEAQATHHALSWAYKCKMNVNFSQKFPCLTGMQGLRKGFNKTAAEFLQPNMQAAEGLVSDDPELAAGLTHLKSVLGPICRLYSGVDFAQGAKHHTKDSILRKPAETVENEEPWEVLLHGDACNNMLFRYDSVTGKPVEVLFIDLQVSREGDPFTDVNYALYVNTSDDLRKKHLTSMLHIYYDTFTEICENFSVRTLPGWSWEEFNRRFHRAQIFGVYMAATLLPRMLKNPYEIMDMQKMQISEEEFKSEEFMQSEKMQQMLSDFGSVKNDNRTLRSRLRGVIGDAVRDGII